MRFIVDESAGASVASYLRGAGHDVLAVADIMFQAADEDVLSKAVGDGRILVTNDKDFGELVFRDRRKHSGIVLLRLEDESPANRVRVMQSLLQRHADRLSGRFTVATERSVRIRPADHESS